MTVEGIRRNWFKEQLAASALASTLGRYQPMAVIQAIFNDEPLATHAELEVLIAALAQIPPGTGTTVTSEDHDQLLAEARRLLQAEDELLGPTLSSLRALRGLRPAWYSGPLYAEILAPFEDLSRRILGHDPAYFFEVAAMLEQRTIPIRGMPSQLSKELTVHLADVSSPGDLADAAIVRMSEEYSVILPYKAGETMYKALCRIFAAEMPTFLTRKGKSLEAFVKRRIETLAPNWSIHPSPGDSNASSAANSTPMTATSPTAGSSGQPTASRRWPCSA